MKNFRWNNFIQNIGYLIDQIGFPVLIAFFILEKSFNIAQIAPGTFECLRRILAHNSRIMDGIIVSRFISENLFVLYNAVSLWALLIRKKPLQKSETIDEIIVPLAAIGIYFSINLLSYIPASVNPLLAPEKHLLALSLAGSLFIFIGLTVSIIAIFQLRYSFAVLVQVRDVISKGLYRHVRHPIYLGYFIQMLGFLLLFPHLWTILWAVMSASLFILRAKIEEKKIATFTPAYREYMKRTPFLVPFWKNFEHLCVFI